jgi:hypothetical protein
MNKTPIFEVGDLGIVVDWIRLCFVQKILKNQNLPSSWSHATSFAKFIAMHSHRNPIVASSNCSYMTVEGKRYSCVR